VFTFFSFKPVCKKKVRTSDFACAVVKPTADDDDGDELAKTASGWVRVLMMRVSKTSDR
jgi:hypothetical protein